ncbi:acyltransferase family protein [Roseibacillus ishigakijimensis]|uniref:Acyltransferase n=1 Tax=Roseibacillus ishigakijimensis TaxID=454146 RepID=A0A934RLV0_9BACT|nr:acyltransferase family protein [Roseibacillus ishigakijimensis]MBK1833213.1 acyltransferase [Roseibacillus ishigakijimensis]
MSAINYRPDIDGLRALAVIAVVLFHCGLGMPGGYIGVDVFFVISGYLISSIIWKKLGQNKFSFRDFWVRRIRRITPAFLAVVLATLTAGYFILLPDDYDSLGKSSFYASVMGANFFFWKSGGYFASSAEEMPLLHMWSLAVEEQFYLFLPLFLWAIFKIANGQVRFVLGFILTGILLSLALSIYALPKDSDATFYLLPTRTWELLAGVLVAFLPRPGLFERKVVSSLLSLAGLSGIILPVFFFDAETAFPGMAALPPVLGAALLIWLRTGAHDGSPMPVVSRALASRPVVFVGLISYSWYLWHWPMAAFTRYLSFGEISTGAGLSILFSSFVLAVLSWKFIENRFRSPQTTKQGRFVLLGVGAVQAAVLVIGIVVAKFNGIPSRLPADALAAAEAKHDRKFRVQVKPRDVRSRNLPEIGDPHGKKTLLLWGDSHAMSITPAFDEVLKKRGWKGYVAAHPSTPPVLDFVHESQYGLGKDSPAFNQAVLEFVKSEKVDTVVLNAYWSAVSSEPDLQINLLKTIEEVIAIGAHPVLLLDVPVHTIDIPKEIAISRWLGRDYESHLKNTADLDKFDGIDSEILRLIKNTGSTILNPKKNFLSEDLFIAEFNGHLLYHDEQHLSTQGALRNATFIEEHLLTPASRP